ncbi:hypothetical protein ABFA25_05500 [Mycobacterium lepromatosis]
MTELGAGCCCSGRRHSSLQDTALLPSQTLVSNMTCDDGRDKDAEG